MEGYDVTDVFYSNDFSRDTTDATTNVSDYQWFKNKCLDFFKNFHNGFFEYKYRDMLKQNYGLKKYYVEVTIEDVDSYDDEIMGRVTKQPAVYLPIMEEAATAVADEVTTPRTALEDGEMRSIQVMLVSLAVPTPLRNIKSSSVSQLVKIPGIVTSASGVRSKATTVTLQCRSCKSTIPKVNLKPGLEGLTLPRRCLSDQADRTKCPLDPYFIRTDNSKCVDFQILKLQERNDTVPHGEMPRYAQLYCDRYLCDKIVPGNHVCVIGIFSIKKSRNTKKGGAPKEKNVGVRQPYIRVVGITALDAVGQVGSISFTKEEEELFKRFASSPNIYQRISESIAPSIYGFENVKKAIACLLFGGSRKKLPDGLSRRGDINILLLGDPGIAKSQVLKFVERASPLGIYTSGKGSSATGLTASVVRDPYSRNFIVEGGAMVLADGGVVCIDEFDKMREDDRVAIHEAMEQQTISIAKAGVTTTLNSRCSVLAAANSVFGRWDDLKGAQNIDFMPTILSRFDMIFIIKDEHSMSRDYTIAKHIMNVHTHADDQIIEEPDGEISLKVLKKYIAYCRKNCGPRLTEAAGDKLKTKYVLMRAGSLKHESECSDPLPIPITVRQLEAIIRISESLAKMELKPFAGESHVDEALRLFQVSTLDAAFSGTLSGSDEFTSSGDFESFVRIEKQLRKRFTIGAQVTEESIINDFMDQKFPAHFVKRVIQIMLTRGELVYRAQRKLLLRIR